ncbi:MAG: hypothetical protein GX639_14530 [Fibrobacter sp.]|nr:hypothetical protein [Fibrobacter sp.]
MGKIQKQYPIIISIAFIVMASFLYFIHNKLFELLYQYLNVTCPVSGNVLVIEGWIEKEMLVEAAQEFSKKKYSYCLLTGKANSLTQTKEILHKAGICIEDIRHVAVANEVRHKTYHMALAARNWLQQKDPSIKTVNVFTGGLHGRKTWAVFKRVFGKDYSIGIISSKAWYCDKHNWWKSKKGIRSIIKSITGYIYGLLWPFGN